MPVKLISHPALLLFLVFLHSFPNSNHPTYSNVPQDEVLIMVIEGVHHKNAGEMSNNPSFFVIALIKSFFSIPLLLIIQQAISLY